MRGGPQGRRGNPHPPSPKAPLCKGSCHGFAVTEGLSDVDAPFGDDSCFNLYPFLPSAPQTLRCAPLARAVAAALRNHPRGTSPPACRPPQGVGADAYIGPLLSTTSAASVGWGDLTPPFPYEKKTDSPVPKAPLCKGSCRPEGD